jgi:hypothetical protein
MGEGKAAAEAEAAQLREQLATALERASQLQHRLDQGAPEAETPE